MRWELPVTPGSYEVRLFFVESTRSNFGSGKRKFDIRVENVLADKGFDIYKVAGSDTGYMSRYTVISDDLLTIDFSRVKDNPILSGIEVRSVDIDYVYRVNVGGPAMLEEGWLPDSQAAPSPYVNTGDAVSMNRPVSMMDDSLPDYVPEKLFKTRRRDPQSEPDMSWDFPVTAGMYEVTLYFAESNTAGFTSGRRLIDASIEGQPVLTGFDIYNEVGGDSGIAKSFVVESDDLLSIDFLRNRKNPVLNGIEIKALAQ